ncbi:YggS family pyridoxal phosphate-dependent enzyme [Shouchella sp. 1P09AA]|uniref:YggS family pyridoxal phosphate-dependent enzyme n=1 Tax=unclassified Shouchella TaxID=2893065 RepID=UPI0039A02C56
MNTNVQENVAALLSRIETSATKVGRSLDDIQIIAVTKYVSVETAKAAIDAGISHIGENRIEGLLAKKAVLDTEVDWHFIGSLQSRKVKDVVGEISVLHSLDRLSLAKELQKRLNQQDQTLRCFVQVNVSGEESKSGLALTEVEPFIEKLKAYDRIKVVGLMTMAPFVPDAEETRPYFKRLKQLQQSIADKNYEHAPCTEVSMGMSNDFEVAIEEGATYIRIGTILVGNEHVSE